MYKRILVLILFIGIVFIAHVSGISQYVHLALIKEKSAQLEFFVQNYYIQSVFLYIFSYICIVTFSLPLAALFTLAGGYFYGVFLGAVYSNIGATIGAACSFLIVRYILGGWLQKKYASQLQAFNVELDRYGNIYLLIIHLVAFLPFFVVTMLAGLTNISLWTFIWTTSVGIFPGSFIYTFAGQQLHKINSIRDVFFGPMLIPFLLFALLVSFSMIIARLRAQRQ